MGHGGRNDAYIMGGAMTTMIERSLGAVSKSFFTFVQANPWFGFHSVSVQVKAPYAGGFSSGKSIGPSATGRVKTDRRRRTKKPGLRGADGQSRTRTGPTPSPIGHAPAA